MVTGEFSINKVMSRGEPNLELSQAEETIKLVACCSLHVVNEPFVFTVNHNRHATSFLKQGL